MKYSVKETGYKTHDLFLKKKAIYYMHMFASRKNAKTYNKMNNSYLQAAGPQLVLITFFVHISVSKFSTVNMHYICDRRCIFLNKSNGSL